MSELKEKLDGVLQSIEPSQFLSTDPLGLVHRYDYPEDQEIAGFLASCLSYGRTSVFIESIEEVFSVLHSPYTQILNNPNDTSLQLSDFTYRMTDGEGLRDLIHALSSVLQRYGTLQECYSSGQGDHLENASYLVAELRKRPVRNTLNRSFTYLIPSPADGSACKRLNMFFRWMVREDEVDLGIWEETDPSELIIPLDTHVHKKATEAGLVQRKSQDLKASVEITERLKKLDPTDPVKYDLALFEAGKRDIEL